MPTRSATRFWRATSSFRYLADASGDRPTPSMLNTLVTRQISADIVLLEAKIVPSGVAEVARLQAQEGFVYLRP